MFPIDEKLAAAIYNAILKTILEMGREEFKKTSFFGSRHACRQEAERDEGLPKAA